MKYPILGLITALSSLSVSATAVSEIPDTTNLSEVRVTAIKQSRSLLRQPVTVTTVRQPEIERLNVAGMKGLSEIAPNFYMPDYGSRMTASIYVRGIGARIDQPAVGLNVDNIPYLNKNSFDFDMADVARVEVLRGPQSTLYGRNTIAGLINVYTINPMTNQGVRISGTATTNGSYKSSIGIYHKLHPRLGMSITAYNAGDAGY
ncbi:MAG: Plug domain-containing protein, partial [Duncaniella sp.]|nr:Plug domain-containing protein [Duncaniella sp.]